ncbi:hypothetical protein [Sphingomonas sp.]|uniref:DUF2306 domain-containing protein n=1 Tax=Sphingomonas sp. TaxID=28214 RepID=UPI00333F513C
MATLAGQTRPTAARALAPDSYERFLAIAAGLLFVTIVVALAKGQSQWVYLPAVVWGHLVTVMTALALTPIMLLRPRGDPTHRLLGRVWVAAMFLTATESFFVRFSNHGNFSFIHLISAYVVIVTPLLWWSARTHRIAAHRRHVRGMVTGALLIAGFFTLPFGRLLGWWLFA